MKKLILITIILFLFSAKIYSEEVFFQKLNLGDSIDYIKEISTIDSVYEKGFTPFFLSHVYLSENLFGIPFKISLDIADSITEGIFYYKNDCSNVKNSLENYYKISEHLKNLYGIPQVSTNYGTSSIQLDEYINLGKEHFLQNVLDEYNLPNITGISFESDFSDNFTKVNLNFMYFNELSESVEYNSNIFLTISGTPIWVEAQKANIRKKPSTNSEIIVSLDKGFELLLIGKQNDWYKVLYEDDKYALKTCWVYNTLVSREKVSTFEHDFRNATWGISKSEIKKIETAKLLDETDEVLMYRGKVGTYDAVIVYKFTNNKLRTGAYFVKEEHTNENLFIEDYNDINKILKTKYGMPTTDDIIWIDTLYKDKYSDWGFAVSLGDLKYSTTWKIGNMSIVHTLDGDNYKINHDIVYFDMSNQKSNEEHDKQISDGF